MSDFVRPVAASLAIACLAASIAILSSGAAISQIGPAPATQSAPAPAQADAIRQIALTARQVEGVLAAAKEMDPIVEKLPDSDQPDPKILAQLDAVAKKNGFASYDDYNDVIDNISLVLEGFDPATKKYVGPEAVIKAQIAKVQADQKMLPKDRQQVLADLEDALKSPGTAIEHKGNIDLVTQFYDKLAEALIDD